MYYSVFNFKGTSKLAFRNAEGGIWTLAPLLTTYSLSRGAPSTTWVLLLGWFINKYLFVRAVCFVCPKRREWDSNPRALSDKRFSRPPRYDRFDTSPCVNSNLGNSRNHLSFWLVSFAFLSLSLSDIRYYISSVSECQPLFWFFFTFFSISFLFSLVFPVLQFTHLFLSIYSLFSVFCFFLFLSSTLFFLLWF